MKSSQYNRQLVPLIDNPLETVHRPVTQLLIQGNLNCSPELIAILPQLIDRMSKGDNTTLQLVASVNGHLWLEELDKKGAIGLISVWISRLVN